MTPILCFGEALVDCLRTGENEVDGLTLPVFRHYPGGAPANVAVAAAKLGADAHFAGQVGNDAFGRFLRQSLARYGVKLDNLHVHPGAPTPLAFVMLDPAGERSFEFLRHHSSDLSFRQEQLDWTRYSEPGIFHVCSNTLTHAPLREVTTELVNTAKARGWKTSFDINLRSNLWPQPEQAPGAIGMLASQVDLVKASAEELYALWPDLNASQLARHWLEQGVGAVVVTNGGEAVSLFIGQRHITFPIPAVSVVDTTAAGDGFVGGLLYSLSRQAVWSEPALVEALSLAIRVGACTVSRPGAYPALPWAHEIL